MEKKEIIKTNLVAANNKEFRGDRYYWPFLEDYMNDYFHSDRIAEICGIEVLLDEDLANIPEDEFNSLREELHRLTLKCIDEALCNFINSRWPGAVQITPKE